MFGGRSGWLVALASVLLALALRLLGLRLGLPFFHHWDECWVADSAKRMLQTSDWEPRTYQYGAPLSALAATLFHALQAVEPKRLLYPDDGVLLRVLCRLVTAVISSSGAAAVYIAARYAAVGDSAGRVRGVYATLLYATAAELVSHGRYGVTDADLVALVAWSLAFGALFLGSGRLVWAAATLFFAAVAFSFKVTALTSLAIPALALGLRPVVVLRLKDPAVGRFVTLAALPSAGVVFALLNPHVFLNWRDAFRDITERARQTVEGGFPQFLIRTPGWDHVRAVVSGLALMGFHRWAIPACVAAALGLAGLLMAIASRSRICAVAAVHAAVAILSVALTSRAYLFRNYLVALPALCIGFGFAMEILSVTLARVRSRWVPGPTALAAAFAVVYVAVPLGQAVRTQQLSLDARTRAVNWINAEAGGGTVSVVFTPDIISNGGYSTDSLRDMLRRSHLAVRSDVKTAEAARTSRADYVVVVSRPDGTGDLGDLWPFHEVPGYRVAATFEANPYEHRFDITSTWDGRFNVIVLAREQHQGA
jgi:hypothetical protein